MDGEKAVAESVREGQAEAALAAAEENVREVEGFAAAMTPANPERTRRRWLGGESPRGGRN